MNANARLWVEDLRTNPPQAKGRLREGEKMCCLGRACEVYRRETGNGEWVPSLSSDSLFKVEGVSDWSRLPDPVRQWLGLQTREGEYEHRLPSSLGHCLSSMNDCGATFAEIADVIESEPEGLFVESGE